MKRERSRGRHDSPPVRPASKWPAAPAHSSGVIAAFSDGEAPSTSRPVNRNGAGLWSNLRRNSIQRPPEEEVEPLPQLRIGMLSSTPPTPCGIATFSMALGGALEDEGAAVHLVRVVDQTEQRPRLTLPVSGVMVTSQPSSVEWASEVLNQYDAVIIQHEYGLYGGWDGDDVVTLMRQLNVPAVVILHTVLPHPTAHQREVLNTVLGLADQVVVMTQFARRTLEETNSVRSTPIAVIPHGAAVGSAVPPALESERPLILTWGLLSPGKGVEWMIDALASLRDLDPVPRYIVAGRTHPKVAALQGEKYRESLVQRARDQGVNDLVEFEDVYRDAQDLRRLIARASVVVLPYDSTDQATSGVLVDALAADRPVVATAFPHAVEALSGHAGIVVPHRDSGALADAVRYVLAHPGEAQGMSRAAREMGPDFAWSAVARSYYNLVRQLVGRERVS